MRDQLESLVSQMVERGIRYADAMREFDKSFIQNMLDMNQGNQSNAAKALGIHRNTLSRKIEDLALDGRPKRRKRWSR